MSEIPGIGPASRLLHPVCIFERLYSSGFTLFRFGRGAVHQGLDHNLVLHIVALLTLNAVAAHEASFRHLRSGLVR